MRVVTFGEIMLCLTPEGYYHFIQAESFGATYGGDEANVTVSLANFGIDASFVTKLPKHDISRSAVNPLRRYGMDTSKIIRGGDRIDIYSLEKSASQRPSKVIYDRVGSAIATAQPSDFNWDDIFESVNQFRFAGITPAISDSATTIYPEVCRVAKRHNVTVSCDLNYRESLWSREEAGRVMGGLMGYVNVCISNEEDASDVFSIKTANTDITGGKISHGNYREVAKKLADTFHFDKVAITLRGSIPTSDNNWAAILYDGNDYYFSRSYPICIIDRVGGDGNFGGDLIYSLLSNYAPQDAAKFTMATSCLKHSIEDDFNQVSVDKVNKLTKGDGSGRVQR